MEKALLVDGTTASETLSVIFPSCLLVFIVCMLSSTFQLGDPSRKYHLKQFFFEFVCIVIPITLNITVFADYIIEITLSLFAVSLTLYIFMFYQKLEETTKIKQKIDRSKKFFITNARTTVNLLSIIAILAVDFTLFPQRFAKTEAYGYSLMDVGVGLYIFANGIVAPEIRGHKSSFHIMLKSTIPLLGLGGVRFFITREIDYYVPVQEYGVHWNFFITLAVTKVLSSAILSFIPIKYAFFNAISLLLAHEIGLQLGLAQFVFSDTARDNFVNANKEGLVSALGYVGLYFLATAYGTFLDLKQNDSPKFKIKFLLKSFIICIALLWATFVLQKNFGISRRLANAGYCVWISFIGVFMLNMYVLVEIVQHHIFKANRTVHLVYAPIIFEAINYNGLVFFLLANILTGLVNIVVDTMNVDTINSLIILNLYTFTTCLVLFLLYIRNIKLKL